MVDKKFSPMESSIEVQSICFRILCRRKHLFGTLCFRLLVALGWIGWSDSVHFWSFPEKLHFCEVLARNLRRITFQDCYWETLERVACLETFFILTASELVSPYSWVFQASCTAWLSFSLAAAVACTFKILSPSVLWSLRRCLGLRMIFFSRMKFFS